MTTQEFLPQPRKTFHLPHLFPRADARRQADSQIHPVFAVVRKWSPVLVPCVVGGAALVFALILIVAGLGNIHRSTIAGVPLLFFICIVGGTIFAYALDVAESEAIWLATVVFGSGIYFAALLSAIAGLLTGMAIIAASALLALLYVQSHTYKVPRDTVAVTQVFNGYLRTLSPGLTILWPGEQVGATFETRERRFLSPPRDTTVNAQNGISYYARATALVSYKIEPELAARALGAINTWERDLHAAVSDVLPICLARWVTQTPIVDGNDVSQASLASLEDVMLTEMRRRAELLGVNITSLYVHNVRLEPADLGIHNLAWQAAFDGAREMSTPVLHDTPTIASRSWPASPGPGFETPWVAPSILEDKTPRRHPRSQPGASPIPAIVPAPDATHNMRDDESPKEAVSPGTLADAYNAVRARRITDPATIRTVARAFADIATDPHLSEELPYDATAAARILGDYAARLDERRMRRARSA